MTAAGLVALAATAALAAGCSGSDEPPGAAEPATAPSPSVKPTGLVVRVGDLPQGLVYDADADLLAVAVRDPYRLLLLDPTTLQATRTVPLDGKVRHLQLSADQREVLVPEESANLLLQVPVDGSTPVGTQVQSHPHDATGAEDGDIVVGNEFSGSLSVVRDGKVVTTVSDLQQPGGVVADADTIAVVDVGAFTLSTYAQPSYRRTGRVKAGEGPTHAVVLGGDRVLVSDTRGDQVLVYSLDPLEVVGHLDLPGSPYGLATDPTTDTVWVTLTARNQVVGLDVHGDTPKVVARYPTVQQPDTVATDPGSDTVWVAGTDGGQVQRITR